MTPEALKTSLGQYVDSATPEELRDELTKGIRPELQKLNIMATSKRQKALAAEMDGFMQALDALLALEYGGKRSSKTKLRRAALEAAKQADRIIRKHKM
jgi:hypothetical protein